MLPIVKLIEIRREAAARLHFALGRHDQGLARPLAVILLEPVAVPSRRQMLRPLHRRQMVPVQRHRQIRRDQQITVQQIRPFDHRIQLPRPTPAPAPDPARAAAGVGQRHDGVAVEDCAGRRGRTRPAFAVWMPWNLSTLRPSLPLKPPSPPSRPGQLPGAAPSSYQTPLVMILSKRKPSSTARRHRACTNSG